MRLPRARVGAGFFRLLSNRSPDCGVDAALPPYHGFSAWPDMLILVPTSGVVFLGTGPNSAFRYERLSVTSCLRATRAAAPSIARNPIFAPVDAL